VKTLSCYGLIQFHPSILTKNLTFHYNNIQPAVVELNMELEIYTGVPFPLGATWNGEGVNFSVFSDNATGAEVCLFDKEDDAEPSSVIEMTDRTYNVWHVYVIGIKTGQLYGFRLKGDYKPEEGKRFNANKLLIDPNAKAISGTIKWHDSLFGYDIHNETEKDLSFSETSSIPYLPKCIVVSNEFDWEDDKPLRIPYQNTIIYEMHVKGFTKLNPDIPEELRGTYAGIAHPASIKYLKALGISAVELMPVHHFVTDRHLDDRGLSNYWGYNTINFFSPDIRYAANKTDGGQINEFREMVKALHKEGIEVILDVVYNHTAEGNEMGPTLSLRGIDNASYYRLADDKRFYMDYTGTGNTLNTQQPNVLRMIMDSLRYWILEMHVDGFRFDLASTLARELHEVDRLSAFFDIIHQDPVISQVKVIAEPWDVGEGGYQVGKFPPGWAEWNGMYRDCIRDYWRGADSMLAEFAGRFTGSADLYKDDRYPTASINFVTAHDGFTMRDLVSYDEKHNEDNQEDNKDGESHNRSWNCGVEGDTDDKDILKLRKQQVRNFIATLFLSQGVPMLVSGDESGRTQQGNNNAYCQDNEISWLNWQQKDDALLAFTQKMIQLRKDHPIFCRTRWFKDVDATEDHPVKDIAWFLPEGIEMTDENWNHDYAKSLAVFLNGLGINDHTNDRKPIVDDDFYIIFNAYEEPLEFSFPGEGYKRKWLKVIDTAVEEATTSDKENSTGITVAGRSVVVLQAKR
jgi:isoamylase